MKRARRSASVKIGFERIFLKRIPRWRSARRMQWHETLHLDCRFNMAKVISRFACALACICLRVRSNWFVSALDRADGRPRLAAFHVLRSAL